VENLLYPIVRRTQDSRCNTEDWKEIKDKSERIGALRAKALNSLIYECTTLFNANYGEIMTGVFDKELPDHIASASELTAIKKLSQNKFYGRSAVIDIELAGFDVLGGLLGCFTDVVLELHSTGQIKDHRNKRLIKKMSEQFSNRIMDEKITLYEKLLICADFISRMTDGYAMKLYKKITGMEL
jgi:dGTPase